MRRSYMGLIALVLVCLLAKAKAARSLPRSDALADDLEAMRQRLMSSTGFDEPLMSRKLHQDGASPVTPTYGYYYGGYYGSVNAAPLARRARSMLGGSDRELLALPTSPSYGYYGYYGAYAPVSSTTGRRMLSVVDRLSEILMGSSDGFVEPGDETLVDTMSFDPRRTLQQAGLARPGLGYGYYYGYY